MRLRAFLEALPLPVIGIDRERNVALWNAAAEHLLGWKGGDVIGGADPSVPPEVAAEQKTLLTSAWRGHLARRRETIRVTRSGALLDVELTTTKIVDGSPGNAMVVMLLHDITEHRAASDLLAERESELRLLLDQLPLIVSTFDRDGVFLTSQGAGLQALGVQPEDFIGHALTDFMPEDHPPIRSLHVALRGGSTNNEYRFRDRVYENRAGPLRDRNGEIIGAVNAALDMTERRLAEAALHESREELRRLSAGMNRIEEERRRHIARELHDELGQLLTALRLDLGIMRRDLAGLAAAAIEERITSMLELVELTIQTVRRVATELRPAVLDDFGLRAAIEHEAAGLKERTGIDVQLSIAREELIDGDVATMIYRVTQEALTNVARHSEATSVEIRIDANPQRVELEVRDNGRGITDAQIHNHSTLGLLGVRERAYSVGGDVVIERLESRGTRVYVLIPL